MVKNVATPEDEFAHAMSTLFNALPSTSTEPEPTAFANFKICCDDVLNGADQGKIQVLLEGKRRYVLLSEDQVIALARIRQASQSLGGVLKGVIPPRRPLDMSKVDFRATIVL